MTMRGACNCRNIELVWHSLDYSVVPRQCQCRYCRSKEAAYVAKPGSRVDVRIRNGALYRRASHGNGGALFHECGNCHELVLVTAGIGGEIFGALNAHCIDNKFGFPAVIETDFSRQTPHQKQRRWQQNWCHPVQIAVREN